MRYLGILVLAAGIAISGWGFVPGGFAAEKVATGNPNRIVREGIAVEFTYGPAGKKGEEGAVKEGEFAEIRFRMTEEATGRPVRSLRPGAWLDIEKPLGRREKASMDCRQKVSLFLRGIVGIRPMVDLNGYFVLVMNREPTIYVIDPFVGITGRTNLYASIPLREPGADWTKSRDEKRIYVTLSNSGKVAVIDTDSFTLQAEADAGRNPVRIALQPDARFLWVGNDGPEGKEGGVTVIDTATLETAASIPTGKGHHELAFSPDSRFAYVTNRAEGTVSVIDARGLKKFKDVKTGPQPISLAFPASAGALYVADGQEGTVSVLDGKTHEVTARIQARPGLGPMRFTQDGRWGLVLNSREDAVHIIDASTNRIAHTVAVGKEPYQMVLTRSFAHVRCLGSERIFMVNLLELGKEIPPPVNSYPVGSEPPKSVPDLGLVSGIADATGEAEVLVADPVSKTTYFYMEGMNTPMGNFRGYGHSPRGVETANRSLKEIEPGLYTGKVRFPVAGIYDVALFLDTPSLIQCFNARVDADPELRKAGTHYEIEYLAKDRFFPVSDNVVLRFRLSDVLTGWGKEGLRDVNVMYFLAPGRRRTQVLARDVGDGVYEVMLSLKEPGAYYVHVAVPSMKIGFMDLLQFSLLAKSEDKPAPPPPAAGRKGKEREQENSK
ncbi:MAG: cytochrome D1 domain-containing protein [Deltaproteobacteria bacterium]